jgi:nitrogenase molybdenum-iron protein alpha chain
MPKRVKNPLLPTGIRWRSGAAKGTVGLSSRPCTDERSNDIGASLPRSDCKKDHRGRKPKPKEANQKLKSLIPQDLAIRGQRQHPSAGFQRPYWGRFILENNAFWGTNSDMLPIAHGPVGCGFFTQSARVTRPDRCDGIDGFTGLHLCTDLLEADIKAGGDRKLAQAIVEAFALFPLAQGATILAEDPIALIDSDIQSVACRQTDTIGKVIIARDRNAVFDQLKQYARVERTRSTAYDIVVTYGRHSPGQLWIITRLLDAIGLNVIHMLTDSSVNEIPWIEHANLSIGFGSLAEVLFPAQEPTSLGRLLHSCFGIPFQFACFESPTATTISLRAIASRFDASIQQRAEEVIETNLFLVEATIEKYHSRLEGKLLIEFAGLSKEELSVFQSFGMRVGNASGWEGVNGALRRPRRLCDYPWPGAEAKDALLREAKPDIVIDTFRRDPCEQLKRGQQPPITSDVFNISATTYWGYDGFVLFADDLDRAVNAPWRKLIAPPWRK